MKQLIILLFTALVLTSCSSSETKTEETNTSQVEIKNDMTINVTDSALKKMEYELKNSNIVGAIYRIDFVYSSAGWGTPVYNLVLDEHANDENWKFYEVNNMIIAVPVSLKEYLSGFNIDYDNKSIINEFLIEPVYWQSLVLLVNILTKVKAIILLRLWNISRKESITYYTRYVYERGF